MSKNKNKNKDCAFVTLVGTVIYSDVVRYDDNKKNYTITLSK